MQERRWFVAILATAAAFGVACSTPVNTGYLANPEDLEPGQYLDGLWCATGVESLSDYAWIHVVSVKPFGIDDQRGISVRHAIASLRRELRRLSNEPRNRDVLLSFPKRGRGANLEIAITQMTPGSVAARAWAGEFGAGHAFVQVEAKLIDAEHGQLLCEFVQRTRASGAIGFRDLGGDSGPSMVRQMLRMIARALQRELQAKMVLGPAA